MSDATMPAPPARARRRGGHLPFLLLIGLASLWTHGPGLTPPGRGLRSLKSIPCSTCKRVAAKGRDGVFVCEKGHRTKIKLRRDGTYEYIEC
jgi:hypothetical protein